MYLGIVVYFWGASTMLTSHELMNSFRLQVDIHRIMVIALRSGPDMVHLETNLPDPMGAGTIAFAFPVPRGTGAAFAAHHFSGVEIVEYRYGIDRAYGMDERLARIMSQAHEQQSSPSERRSSVGTPSPR